MVQRAQAARRACLRQELWGLAQKSRNHSQRGRAARPAGVHGVDDFAAMLRALADGARGSSEGSSLVPTVMASLLFLPLLIGFAWFWWCGGGRTHGSIEVVSAYDDDDGEEDGLGARGRDRKRDTPVCFRKSEWSSCTRRPLVTKISLDHVGSIPVSIAHATYWHAAHATHWLTCHTLTLIFCSRALHISPAGIERIAAARISTRRSAAGYHRSLLLEP